MINIDLYGLICTVAASTGVIVAIVGGLLLSRLISLSSEKNGIVQRLKELEADLQARKEQSDETTEWLSWENAKLFISNHGRELVWNNANFEELVNPEKSPYKTAEELKQISERDHLNEEISSFQYQIGVEKKKLESSEETDNLWLGLLVIIFSSSVGVIWPVMLLPYSLKVHNDVITNWIVLGCFFSALVALFSYLVWSSCRSLEDDEAN